MCDCWPRASAQNVPACRTQVPVEQAAHPTPSLPPPTQRTVGDAEPEREAGVEDGHGCAHGGGPPRLLQARQLADQQLAGTKAQGRLPDGAIAAAAIPALAVGVQHHPASTMLGPLCVSPCRPSDPSLSAPVCACTWLHFAALIACGVGMIGSVRKQGRQSGPAPSERHRAWHARQKRTHTRAPHLMLCPAATV
jgi:hypothetical protein